VKRRMKIGRWACPSMPVKTVFRKKQTVEVSLVEQYTCLFKELNYQLMQ